MTKIVFTISAFALLLRAPVAAELTAPGPLKIQVTADSEDYVLDTQQFTAQGNARVTYGDVVLNADRVVGSAQTGDVEAVGNVRFKNLNRSLTGESFTYNFRTDVGLARNAAAESDSIFFRAEELRADPAKYQLHRSRFTTCNLDHPHYYLSARELVMEPGEQLIAKGVKVVISGKTLFHLPRYRVDLTPRERRRGLRLPTIGMSERSGLFAGYQFDLQHGPNTRGSLDVRLSSKLVFQGGLAYDQIAGRPVFLRGLYREAQYSGTKGNLIVSRLPEIGVRLGPIGAGLDYSTTRQPLSLSRDLINPLEEELEATRSRVIGEVGWGQFTQDPGDVATSRLDARALGILRPIHLTEKTIFAPGLYGRVSNYGTGDTYTDIAFRLGLAQRLGDRSYVSVGYVNHSTQGDTPFDFDAVDPHEELAATTAFPLGEYGIVLSMRYNLAQSQMYDTEVSISRVFHCIEPSVTWRSRFREISFDVGLVRF